MRVDAVPGALLAIAAIGDPTDVPEDVELVIADLDCIGPACWHAVAEVVDREVQLRVEETTLCPSAA
jgi:hypothetical protein